MVLVNLSGGIDSTYAAWKCLQEAKKTKKNILIHHVHLCSKEKRHEKEWEAVKSILRWFRTQGLKYYQLIEHSFGYGTIDAKLPGFACPRVRDLYIVAFCTGIALRRFTQVDTVVRSITSDEISTVREMHDGTFEERQERFNEILTRLGTYPGQPDRKIKRLDVIGDKNKIDIIREMPKDLLNKTWSCRRPKMGKPCGKCDTCNLIKKCYNEFRR